MSIYYIQRRPSRFRALPWTGDNQEEIRELDPWEILWDEHTNTLYVSQQPVQVGDWLVQEPGGVSALSPELFAMEFMPASNAA